MGIPSVPKAGQIFSKVLSKTDAIGALAGFYTQMGDLNAISYHCGRILLAPRPPDTAAIMTAVQTSVMAQIPLIVGGILLEYIDIESVNKYAHAIIKFGVGSVIGTAVAAAIIYSHNPQGGQAPTGPASSNVWTQNTNTGAVTTAAMNSQYAAVSPVALPVK